MNRQVSWVPLSVVMTSDDAMETAQTEVVK